MATIVDRAAPRGGESQSSVLEAFLFSVYSLSRRQRGAYIIYILTQSFSKYLLGT